MIGRKKIETDIIVKSIYSSLRSEFKMDNLLIVYK